MRPNVVRWLKPAWSARMHRSVFYSTTTTNVVKDMTQRGLVANVTSKDIGRHTEQPTCIYCGVDPTANSLHLGNLVTLMGLLHFHIRGHQTIALVGGATGSIGDPSGRSTERVPLGKKVLDTNVKGINTQLQSFFEKGRAYAERRGYRTDQAQPPLVLNNYDWFSGMSALAFLGDVGCYARVSTMLAKESVKSRLESTQGISFTEFSYQLLQAYDFYHLFRNHGCSIQLGGSDQWGNITAGIDMIAKRSMVDEQNAGHPDASQEEEASKVYGITIPLLVTSSGEKFGKSAGNAVWLDKSLTSLFDFYQFFARTTDADVHKYLTMFTLLDINTISDIIEDHQVGDGSLAATVIHQVQKYPEQRRAQHVLAREVTELVHGEDAVTRAQTATKILFGEQLDQVAGKDILRAFEDDARRLTMLHAAQIIDQRLDAVAVLAGASKSKSEAQKQIKAGAMYLNQTRVTDPRQIVSQSDLIDGVACVLRTGKASYHLIGIHTTLKKK